MTQNAMPASAGDGIRSPSHGDSRTMEHGTSHAMAGRPYASALIGWTAAAITSGMVLSLLINRPWDRDYGSLDVAGFYFLIVGFIAVPCLLLDLSVTFLFKHPGWSAAILWSLLGCYFALVSLCLFVPWLEEYTFGIWFMFAYAVLVVPIGIFVKFLARRRFARTAPAIHHL
ncbi:hypothetical protein NQ038_11635 [Brevibacterium sp. 50QC2O2]|jgi:hypothetical protein|uniref:hypothetical protein n=1 Tax=Brevibacterium TaxID=1696 RepID=UPI00211C61AF|nr:MULTISPECIES: hypothetical protein [unclassified Brevibacterium]MCQ9369149.1 hypothetical protein [Brevibacterium sp. 91QC2O2]MCQ9386506.1 hypothetical protein [Brevibacterium sp. 68QC2CO]MCQ9389290.1 hypothetical protein [Brevibacterium sp. 50QC2O2]